MDEREHHQGAIGVAISGGGHRAALFGLGVLLYLVDAGKNRQVSSIASVSGGSMTNGFVGQAVDFKTADRSQFEAKLRPFVRCLAQEGTVWPPRGLVLAYLVLLGLVAVGTFVGVWFLPVTVWLRIVAFFVALAVLGVVVNLRGWLVARVFAGKLYSPAGRPTQLGSIAKSLDHVICACDLHAGENVYFSGRFVCSYRFGWGEPADLPLHLAVQASAALPGAFPPRWLPTSRHAFREPLREAERATHMCLVDGGVYDNMADQWVYGMANRRERFSSLSPDMREATELIVVNGSGGLEWGPVWKVRIPLAGELLALLRDKSVLYDNGNSLRREMLRDRFEASTGAGRGLLGALVHIPRSAVYVPSRYSRSDDAELTARAGAVLDLLVPNRTREEAKRWRDLADRASRTSTSLSKLGTERTADLLQHGYVLAMANLHVILGYPLLELPERSRLEALTR